MWKIQTPPPLVKVVYIWNVDYFDFGFTPPPPLWTFSTICDIVCLEGSPSHYLSHSVAINKCSSDTWYYCGGGGGVEWVCKVILVSIVS